MPSTHLPQAAATLLYCMCRVGSVGAVPAGARLFSGYHLAMQGSIHLREAQVGRVEGLDTRLQSGCSVERWGRRKSVPLSYLPTHVLPLLPCFAMSLPPCSPRARRRCMGWPLLWTGAGKRRPRRATNPSALPPSRAARLQSMAAAPCWATFSRCARCQNKVGRLVGQTMPHGPRFLGGWRPAVLPMQAFQSCMLPCSPHPATLPPLRLAARRHCQVLRLPPGGNGRAVSHQVWRRAAGGHRPPAGGMYPGGWWKGWRCDVDVAK